MCHPGVLTYDSQIWLLMFWPCQQNLQLILLHKREQRQEKDACECLFQNLVSRPPTIFQVVFKSLSIFYLVFFHVLNIENKIVRMIFFLIQLPHFLRLQFYFHIDR